MAVDLSTLSDLSILALTIWGEARGEPVEGQIAVACVVANRLRLEAPPLNHWRDICLAPAQFSCFNPDSPEAPAMQRAAQSLLYGHATPELNQATWIADGMIRRMVKDNTGGALNYLTTQLLQTAPPSWALHRPVLAVIGRHSFLIAA